MWNNYLEKAKALAETIDSQINDAVGIPNESSADNTINNTDAAENDLNDAWNDDFDNDDDIVVQETRETIAEIPVVSTAKQEEEAVSGSSIVKEPESLVESFQTQQEPTPVDDDAFVENQEEEYDDVDITTPIHENTKTIPQQQVEQLPSPPALNVETNHDHFQPPQEEENHINVVAQQETIEDTVTMEDSPQLPRESPVLVVEQDDESLREEQSAWDMEEPNLLDEEESDGRFEINNKHESEQLEFTSSQEISETVVTTSEMTPVVQTDDVQQEEEEEEEPVQMVNEEEEEEKPVQIVNEEEEEVVMEETKATTQAQQDAPLQPVQQVDTNMSEQTTLQLKEEHQLAMTLLQSQVEDLQAKLVQQRDGNDALQELQTALEQREQQLASKSEQMTTMQTLFESEKEELRSKIRETKEEAKKRIQKAKERVQDMEKRLTNASKSANEAGAQEEIIVALRQEGEKLARKQSEMEQAVRAAKGETRELTASLQQETDEKEKALDKIATLEADLKQTREELASARSGESRAGKLDMELSAAKEESELKAAANLSLDQQVKELKGQNKELMQELQEATKAAAAESAQASEMIKKEHGEVLSDLETKLRTSEREASVREDALRHEVAELRKRWQDAVRRADALSMDVQSSTAPLMRQLESTERQNRARAAAWAELETKLRSDLEENVIQNENLIKERNELRTNHTRLQRGAKEMEEELKSARVTIEEKNAKVQRLEEKLLDMETEGQRMKEEWVEVERLANEGVAKVRSDMMKTVVESEERYQLQVETMEKDLSEEREKRIGFERQLEELLHNTGIVSAAPNNVGTFSAKQPREKKLKAATGQAEILASTLSGIDSDYEEEDDESLGDGDQAVGGFAAMEQLTQRLKGSTVELEALRKQLSESEKTRESLVSELGETRQASEKLPLFEAKVSELTDENREMELEIMGLREDIAEVRHLYRTQLDALLEEKAATVPEDKAMEMNGDRPQLVPEAEPEGTSDPSEQER